MSTRTRILLLLVWIAFLAGCTPGVPYDPARCERNGKRLSMCDLSPNGDFPYNDAQLCYDGWVYSRPVADMKYYKYVLAYGAFVNVYFAGIGVPEFGLFTDWVLIRDNYGKEFAWVQMESFCQ